MLNISENGISKYINLEQFQVSRLLQPKASMLKPYSVAAVLVLLPVILLFVPWTQNIRVKGHVTTRLPEQRPQTIQSVISGRLEKWYVSEGDFVRRGDTIVFLSEVKQEYFDPNLVERTSEQVDAKEQSIYSYDLKLKALDDQLRALREGQQLKQAQLQNKLLQTRNKLRIDSIDLNAYNTQLEIARNQLQRIQELQAKGLKSLSDLQEKQLKLQEAQAKTSAQVAKLLNQHNELDNLLLEMASAEREYAEKIAKTQSDRQSALSDKLEAVGNASKLQNQLSNYNLRQQFYHITAPQDGYITKTMKKGIGEIIKEGAEVASIMPSDYDLAVEVYVRPHDLPLLRHGNDAVIQFDGWPAIVISGWPEASTGIFQGEVVVMDQFIGDNGYYRLLLSPKEDTKAWPLELRVGTGTQTILVLNRVPLWYELWRQLNGFPPDFYQNFSSGKTSAANKSDKENSETKAPIKSVK